LDVNSGRQQVHKETELLVCAEALQATFEV